MKYANEEHLSKEQQDSQAAFYTPQKIAKMMAKILIWKTGQTVFDPTCGKGNLFLAMKEIYPELTNDLIYGIDIDPEAINYCREHFPGGHFKVANILETYKKDIESDKWWLSNRNTKRKSLFEKIEEFNKGIK